MLRVGLTGGIGSGKSTVAGFLRGLGAVVTDADEIARQVVEPGQPALEAIAAEFGPGVLRADGALDRAALSALVFSSPQRLRALEAITHSAIAAAAARRRAQIPADRVDVYDVPLLIERGLWVYEHLTLVVGGSESVRVDRLVGRRGLAEADARARIAAQASDAERRAAADLWVDNDGPPEATREQVERHWAERLVPFDDNLRSGRPAPSPTRVTLCSPDPAWVEQGARVVARLAAALEGLAARVDHVGATSVPGLPAQNVLDVQVGVRRLSDADTPEFAPALRRAGYVPVPSDDPRPSDDPVTGPTTHGSELRSYAGCDPGRVTRVEVREAGSAGHDAVLAHRDWLGAASAHRQAYAAEQERLAAVHGTSSAYRRAEAAWFAHIADDVAAWRRQSGWKA